MTKSQLSSHIAGKAGITKKAANEIIDDLAAIAYKETKSSGQFTL
ncbi:MAG: HU family DNA-binding protein, partial [Thermodesulfobacteriota bacterium]